MDKKQRAREYARAWRKNPDNIRKFKQYFKRWKIANPDKIKAYAATSRAKRRTQIRISERARYRANREYYLAKRKERYNENREATLKQTSAWQKKNPHLTRIYRRNSRNKRYRNDPAFRILHCLRCRIRQVLRGKNKSAQTLQLLGCSILDFRIYLESKFDVGMTWENYGKGKDKWCLDHIMPCAIFDFSKPEHQKRCFHFSNYQPLWELDNLAKHHKVTTNQFNLL